MLGAGATGWLLVGVFAALLDQFGLKNWIELFNGATWPMDMPPSGGDLWPTLAFYAVLSFRTLVNLGVVLSIGWAFILLYGGGLEGLVMRRMESVLHGRDVALAGYLIKVMREQHVNLPDGIAKQLMAAAKEFTNTPAGKLYGEEAQKAGAQKQ